jgi:hypothetical protein
MKGLVLATQNKENPEAKDLVNQGLRYNIKSHVCWHVLGLYHRANRDYLEAIKAYQCALRIDKVLFILSTSQLLCPVPQLGIDRCIWLDRKTCKS